MAIRLDPNGIFTDQTIEASQVSQSIDALTGTSAYDINISGSFEVTGSFEVSGSAGSNIKFPSIATNITAVEYGQVLIDPDGVLYSGSAAKGQKGQDGSTGPKGQQGQVGPIGPKGIKGQLGAQGPLGPVGPLGPIGPKGIKGEIGSKGSQGDIGPKGIKGEIGSKGIKGEIGLQGPIGPKGIKGEIGSKGIKGEIGLQGPIGPKGIKGEIGSKGIKGEIGLQGPIGPKGQKGEVGLQGPIGQKGQFGVKGVIGPKGQKGEIGLQGPIGPKGIKGEIGPKGQKGEIGSKGQKGEIGTKGQKGSNSTIANDANNRVTTADGAGGLNAEEFLTFDGTNLIVTGSIALSGSFKDQENSTGTLGQVLASTATGSQWVDVNTVPGGAGFPFTGSAEILGSLQVNNANDSLLYLNTLSSANNRASEIRFQDNGGYSGGINYNHTQDRLIFQTNSNTAITIDQNQNVGIGTTQPSYPLEIKRSGDTNVFISSGTTNKASLYLGDTTFKAWIRYDNSTEELLINSNGIEVLDISPIGNIGIEKDILITGSLHVSQSIYDTDESTGTVGQVLSSTVSGSQWIDASGGDVTKTGTITANQVAIWNDSTDELRSDPTFVIDSNHKITLYQPKISGGAADISTSNIGGGNLANVTGAGNTGFGKNNLNSLTQGFSNNAFGEDALLSLTTGTFNVAVGSLALKTNLIGGSNTAIGNSAYRSGTGSNNTSIGAQSLFGATTGTDNVAVGYKAIAVGTGISFATAVGTSAIEYNIGNGNTAIGYHALRGPSSGTVNGNSNTAVGNGSLKSLTTSTNSTALGSSSGQNVTTGGNNTLIGSNAGSNMTINNNNTFVGTSAGSGLNSTSAFNGNGNTFIGKFAGVSTTTATDCVIIGSNNGSTIAALSNHIIFSDGDGNIRQTFDNTGVSSFKESILITGSLHVSQSIYDTNNSTGTAGQVLSSTVSGSQWVDGSDPNAVTGTGTTGTITKWTTGGSVIGDSIIADDGSTITVSGNIKIPNSGTIGSIGTNNAITILSGGQVGIGGTPSYPLHVSGNVIAVENSVPAFRLIGGTTSFDLKSDGGVFKVRDVSSGSELYHIAAGGSGYHKWYINDSLKMNLDSVGNVLITGSLIDKDNATGTAGQVLSSTGTQLSWIDVSSGFPFTGDAEITGSLLVSGSFVDFTDSTGISGSSFTGSFTGSFKGDGSGLTDLPFGETSKLLQTTPATTWSFTHNMNEQFPVVTVYSSSDEIIIPTKINAVSTSALELYFDSATAGTAVAVVGGTATNYETGANVLLNQSTSATTWSFNHKLGNRYPQVSVFDTAGASLIPGKVQTVDTNNLEIYFDIPQDGTATATVGGSALTSSFSNQFDINGTLLTTQENTDVDNGTETIATVSTTSYTGAFFDYVLNDGTNYRAGTVTSIFDGSNVQYNDNSTLDIGNTSGVTFLVDIDGTTARLRATVTTNNWTIKSFTRAL